MKLARALGSSLATLALVTAIGAVEAAPPPGRFVVEITGVIHDTRTGLRWERTPPTNPIYTRFTSNTYCGSLALAGGGWRVPTVKELLTIVDWAATTPPLFPTAFFDGAEGDYWASTTAFQDGASRYFVNFGTGASNTSDQNSRYVRCVR